MKEKRNRLWPALLIIFLDIVIIMIAGGAALLVRFEFSFSEVPQEYIARWVAYLPIQLFITVAIFAAGRMYRYIWHTVGIYDVANMIFSILLAFAVSTAAGLAMGLRMPISVYMISVMLQMFLLVGMRCVFRFREALNAFFHRNAGGRENIMLIGAGEAGRVLLREISSSKHVVGEVRCLIDDNPKKWGKYMEGVRIYGGRDVIGKAAEREKITQIIFAIPSATAADRREILELCYQTGCHVRVLPGLYQMVNGEVSLADVKDIQVEDLLGREPIHLDMGMMYRLLQDKTVMVTGGGGSIGSELCRQIARYEPRKLIILDIYENSAYDLQQELRRQYGPKLNLVVEIASVRDQEKINALFAHHRPDIVFHAAAHKHVPLMEHCPAEAIKNNIFGTWNVVHASETYGVGKFVLISTDKAVNPTNVMGATKRFCEMILQSRSSCSTDFVAVRFGNVLGSNGSVVPLFRKQIEAGGPVTITDKRMIRYFMTIPEAVQLVLEAGAIAERNQTFVLDMGEPVRILGLAENMIRLSGKMPYRDIEIRETGLRPGEKLYEELLTDSDSLIRTSNEKIFVEQQDALAQEHIYWSMQQLQTAIEEDASNEMLIALLRQLIPTYHAPEQINALVGAAQEEGQLSIDETLLASTLQA